MTQKEIEKIREQARQKRYKKPINRDFNMDSIKQDLLEMMEACQDVGWFFEGGSDELLEELIGGEDETREFKFMFSMLASDCERMLDDLENEYVPEMFDMFMAAESNRGDGMMGYDTYVEDYMGIEPDWNDMAIKEARTRVKRLTKDQILDGGMMCFRICKEYIGLKSRYEDLKASMDLIRCRNRAELEILKKINELYDAADRESNGFRYNWKEEVLKLEQFISGIDGYSQMWIG